MKKLKNKKGLTLLEVIITIAIVSIIIPVAFSVLGFGNKTFNSGISRRDIQQNVRNISTVLNDEIRFAEKDIKIMKDTTNIDSDAICIVLDENGIRKYEDGKQKFQLGSTEEIDFNITYSASGDTLEYTIVGDPEGKNKYSIKSSVKSLNKVAIEVVN